MMMRVLIVICVVLAVVRSQAIDIKVDPTLPPAVTKAGRVTAPPVGINSSICYKYVGCFDTYPPFDNTGGVLPNPPERVGTVILLYTNKDPGVGQQIDYKDKGVSLKASDFDPRFPTKFVIHGFTQNEREEWVHEMKDTLLTTGPLNVIIVGWGEGASAPDYPKAVANTRLVAVQVKLLVDLMVSQGMELSRIHLIGHSLGAHISGYVGASLGGKIGRISGMDPAGPYYEGHDETVRLNPTDAQFVDVIHSNAKPLLDGGAGIYTPSGHVDFYPNGGQEQPGCPALVSGVLSKIFTFKFKGAFNVVSCSHSRSHYIYMESLKSQGCQFLAYPCSSWEDYTKGACSTCGEHGCSELGYHSIEYAARGTFYLMTKGFPTSDAPDNEMFCGVSYSVQIVPSKDSKDIKGKIELKIKGDKNEIKATFQGNEDTLSGSSKVIIVDYANLGDMKSVQLTYNKNEGFSFFGFGSGTDQWEAQYLLISHQGVTSKFCAGSPVQVKTGSTVTLNRC